MEKSPADLIGSTLDNRYQILSEVGKGRIGVVYQATDIRLQRTVAIKLLYQDVTGNKTGYARFEREARSTGCLSHPNIVTVFDFGLSENFPYLVMEYLEGRDLHDAISVDGGRLSLERSIRLLSQTCAALGHAHNRGVVHRDMKPSNIMLIDVEGTPDFVKVVDFGIAKRFDMDEETYERLTMEGQIIGTPAYMSPEQCQAKRLDARSDIYSMGCVLFKCLTGSPPHSGSGLIEVMQAHIHGAPMRFEDVPNAPEIPPELQHIVYQALAKQPEQRQQSMMELRYQLSNYLASLSSVTSKQTMPIQRAIVDAPLLPAAAAIPSNEPNDIVENLIQQAAAGDPKSQYLLSIRYESGEEIQANQVEAARLLRAAADAGLSEAQFKLARQLLTGDGRPASPAAGIVWLQRAAEQNYEPAVFAIANCYESGDGFAQDLVQAVKWYRRSATLGNKQAESRLAACYRVCVEHGLQPEGFLEWLTSRANEGDANAYYGLACYWRANGGSHATASDVNNYLQQAAYKGHAAAQLELARLMLQGKGGLVQSGQEAFSWIKQAAQNGNHEAMTMLACCYKNGIGTAADPNQALQLLIKAAENNVLDAQVLLASAMLIGDSVPRNITRGISLLKYTAEQGRACAQWKLALCYKNGIGVMRDTREAEKWLVKSSEGRFDQGLPWQANVQGLQFEEAVQTFQALVNLDHKHAYYWLGICYEDALCLRQDLNKALELYQRAAQKGLEYAILASQRLRGQMQASVSG